MHQIQSCGRVLKCTDLTEATGICKGPPPLRSGLEFQIKSFVLLASANAKKPSKKENYVSVPQAFLKEITSGLTLLSLG